MKLGTLLLRNAAIGLAQLEGALRNQVLYGGRLGTNLVELGFIDLELLSIYLSDLTGFPIATPTLLDDADATLLGKLGSDDAHRLRAVPLGYLGEGTDRVAVAMVDPFDEGALAELGERFGAHITAYVVPELRALYYSSGTSARRAAPLPAHRPPRRRAGGPSAAAPSPRRAS